MKTCDVLIVGGGLTGASLALALAELGLNISLAEAVSVRERCDSSGGERALALAKGSVGIFSRLGIWPNLCERATPIRHIHISDRGHFGKTRLNASDLGVDAFGQVLLAKDLERVLAEACAKKGIEILCPARLIKLEVRFNAVEASLIQNGQRLIRRARLLVAADGGKSQVRRWVGIGQTTHDYGQTAVIGTVYPESPKLFTAFERFTATGPLALLPLPRGRSALIWTLPHKEACSIQAMPLKQFEQHLQEAFGWKLGRLHLDSPLYGFPLRLIRAERLFAERVALVGNAAHQLHPVAGQGLNLGLRDVAVLARLLVKHLKRGGDPGAFTVLERYAKLRSYDHDRIIGFSHALALWFTPTVLPLVLTRNLGLLALDLWPLGKRLLVEQAMGEMDLG
ncbi:MAG: 2-octaprenyl-6-methoxyphenyl hydroxylase [Methylohalobius sp.]|nr:2-octaprenyl-6-methoxyphenyl hydroxylase [Methylohalobius sp.]